MAYVLSKFLNPDVCDEINKHAVNDKIKFLKDWIKKITQDYLHLEAINDARAGSVRDYIEEIGDLTEQLDYVDIPELICNSVGDFLRNFDAMDGGNGIAFNISKGYQKDENNWFSDCLFLFVNYVCYNADFNVSFQMFQKANKWGCDNYGQFNFGDNSEIEIARNVVHNLILERFDNCNCDLADEHCRDNGLHQVKDAKKKMLKFYKDTVKEEKKERKQARKEKKERKEAL